ncbi:MAG: enoyl-CoA hydratase-related protein [Candidatus Alcyoniella australis]|nr:enoyl-CoA hydratase-related protein [Candidatus Alcyoniella australis]
MEFEDVLFERTEHTAKISINRPEVYNAFRTQTIEELHSALAQAADDSSIGVIVLRGAAGGPRPSFCSGGDVNEMLALDPANGRVFLYKLFNLFQRIRNAPKPVIAAVDGFCLGGGNEINLVCDLTLATRRSVFGQVGPSVGSIPLLAGTQLLPRLVGDKRAKEIIFLCRRYSASEALDLGWINHVVDDEGLDQAVDQWCERILQMSPQSLRIAKASLNFESDQLLPSFTHGIEALALTYGSEELTEGMQAFLEKRKPEFNNFRK